MLAANISWERVRISPSKCRVLLFEDDKPIILPTRKNLGLDRWRVQSKGLDKLLSCSGLVHLRCRIDKVRSRWGVGRKRTCGIVHFQKSLTNGRSSRPEAADNSSRKDSCFRGASQGCDGGDSRLYFYYFYLRSTNAKIARSAAFSLLYQRLPLSASSATDHRSLHSPSTHERPYFHHYRYPYRYLSTLWEACRRWLQSRHGNRPRSSTSRCPNNSL